jgi:cobalamin biosynthesis protein CobD/CbiB
MAKTRTSPKRRKRNARIAHYTGAALMGVGAIGSGHYSGTASRQAIDAKHLKGRRASKLRAAAKISKRRVWPWAATAIAGLGIWYKSGKTLQELKKSTGS